MDILRQRVPFFFHHCSAYYDIVNGVSPLLLPKAKANSLQYVKAFGGTEQSGTPTPDYPIDIVSNNGVLKVRQNLWKGNYTDLGYLDLNGVVVPTAGYMASDFIEIDQSKKYTFYEQILSTYTGNGMRICFYNSNKQMVGQRQGDSAVDIGVYAYIVTPPANAKYIRVSTGVRTGYVTDITLVEGEYNTTTIQGVVGSVYTDGTVETINVHGKNLFDVDNNLLAGYYINTSTGILTQSSDGSSSCFKDFLPSKPNVTYTMSRVVTSTTAMRMWAYDKDKNPISLVFNSQLGAVQITGTTPAGTAYIRCSFGSIPRYSQNIQLEQGSTTTTYEPYFNGGTATTEMLLKVGNYQDVQSIIDGVVTRNIGVKVLDGTEGWTQSAATNNLFYTTINNSSTDNTYIPVSSHFQGVVASTGYATMTNGQFKHGSGTNSWYFKNTDCANATAFSQWLADQYAAGTPVIVVYPLATPTTDSVTGQTLQVQSGDNILEITQASMDDLKLEATYRRNK